MSKVIWLSLKEGTPARGYWDQYLLEEIYMGCDHVYEVSKGDYATVIIPGAYQYDILEDINKELRKLKSCDVIITSDEENNFPLEHLQHPNMRLFSTYPHYTPAEVTWLPIGYPPQLIRQVLGKDIDWSFAGQVNHESRKGMVEKLKELGGGGLFVSDGFAQGLEPTNYYNHMARSKVVPAPKGNISPDSFRLWEALELGCTPVVEDSRFWQMYFDAPFPAVDDVSQWTGYVQDAIEKYPDNQILSWWKRKKEEYRRMLNPRISLVTVVIPVSPLPSHPDTSILEETIDSVKHHLPNSEIVLTFDGVRKEQEHLEDLYNESIRKVITKYRNITPFVFDEHLHQVGMFRKVIDYINRPLVLYVEQDTPLVTDEYIDWQLVQDSILSGESNLIRFHFEAAIHPEHQHLMIGQPENGLYKTAQWSQRPHIASVAFYKRVLSNYFTDKANCFIEDKMHGNVIEDFLRHGEQGWQQWRLHIYYPEGNIKRSYHTDGRAGGEKYDTYQIW